MKLATFDAIVAALDGAGVRYLVAGGLAVNAHGYLRMTNDVDLVVQLERANIRLAFDALASIGYRPTVPVSVEQVADPATRRQLIEGKAMQVLNFHSDLHKLMAVDIFITEPFDFDREYATALQGTLSPGHNVRFVSIPTLIDMKRRSSRAHDLVDIERLQMIQDGRERT